MDNFWAKYQDLIKKFCSDYDGKWQKRKRTVDTLFLVLFIIKLVTNKNKQGYKSTLLELWEHEVLSEYQNNPVASSTICEARQKLPADVFLELNDELLKAYSEKVPASSWQGHSVYAVDGSKITLPRELVNDGYRTPNKGQYYPQGIMSCIYNVGNSLVFDCFLSHDKSERHSLIAQMDKLSTGDILILDRGYFSYLLLHKAIGFGINLICRLQFGTMNKAIKEFCDRNITDAIIDYYPSEAVKSEIKKQGYNIVYKNIKLRLIKYTINDTLYVCATTLLDEKYKADEIAQLYHSRWGIEELYKISKEFINVEEFHSKNERGVKQELYAHIFLINIARVFENKSAESIPVSSQCFDIDMMCNHYWQGMFRVSDGVKINFKNCLLVVGRHISNILLENVCTKIIIRSISRAYEKIRPGRHFQRKSNKPYTKWQSSNASKVAKAA